MIPIVDERVVTLMLNGSRTHQWRCTPDDIEALELCQKGFRNRKEAPWNDYSKGMAQDSKSWLDEAQLRSFWHEWRNRMVIDEEPAR